MESVTDPAGITASVANAAVAESCAPVRARCTSLMKSMTGVSSSRAVRADIAAMFCPSGRVAQARAESCAPWSARTSAVSGRTSASGISAPLFRTSCHRPALRASESVTTARFCALYLGCTTSVVPTVLSGISRCV